MKRACPAMTEHRLDPLLKPRSIALLGASMRTGTPGHILSEMVIRSDYAGPVYPINPGYAEIMGTPCFATLDSLPETVDHAVIALGNRHLESALEAVIAHGTRAATIYASGILTEDETPVLRERIQAMAREAGLAVCGINGMGFYNVAHNLHAGIFSRPRNIIRGGISHIAQSGSAFTALTHNGSRLGFNFAVSTGNELTVTAADFMDWCLEQPETRVISLFLETVRDPDGFLAALGKAAATDIPVVVLKVGRSELGGRMAVTHTGALAGDHAAFEAVCRRHGVILVDDLDEMAAILMLLQTGRRPASGGLAAMFESGGFRALFTDLAEELRVPLATLSESTVNALTPHLEPGLIAENPLDAWGTSHRFEERFLACLRALMTDPGVAAGAFVSNFRDDYFLSEAIYRVVAAVCEETDKPLALVNMYSDLAHTDLCRKAFEAGIPVIDGASEALKAFHGLFSLQNLETAVPEREQTVGDLPECIGHKLMAQGNVITENDALDILAAAGIPVVARKRVSDESALHQAMDELQFPLVLKTASAAIHHKSDSGGVVLGIGDRLEMVDKYRDMSERLGPEALVCAMVDGGMEIGIGTFTDPRFGPMIMVAAGGVFIEVMADRAVAPCPVSTAEGLAMLERLRLFPLLQGMRGKKPVDLDALVDVVVRVSRLAADRRSHIADMDINPVIATPDGAVAVDALIHCHRNSGEFS